MWGTKTPSRVRLPSDRHDRDLSGSILRSPNTHGFLVSLADRGRCPPAWEAGGNGCGRPIGLAVVRTRCLRPDSLGGMLTSGGEP